MSTANAMLIKQSEAAAAKRTLLFHLTLSSDHTSNATGKVPAASMSKAGAAFGAPAGAITEIANGWYKLVLAAGDVDTVGQLALLITEASSDTLRVVHQVYDQLDTNTIAMAANVLTAAAIAADADAELQSGVATASAVSALTVGTKSVTKSQSFVADGHGAGISMVDAIDCTVTLSGTYGGGSATVEVCEDPKAASPVWTPAHSAYTSGTNSLTVAGPHNAIRVSLSGSTAPALAATFVIRKAAASN